MKCLLSLSLLLVVTSSVVRHEAAASEYLVGAGKLFVTADTVDEGVEIVKGSDVSEGSGTAVFDLCPSPYWRSSRRGIGLC